MRKSFLQNQKGKQGRFIVLEEWKERKMTKHSFLESRFGDYSPSASRVVVERQWIQLCHLIVIIYPSWQSVENCLNWQTLPPSPPVSGDIGTIQEQQQVNTNPMITAHLVNNYHCIIYTPLIPIVVFWGEFSDISAGSNKEGWWKTIIQEKFFRLKLRISVTISHMYCTIYGMVGLYKGALKI